MALSKKQLADVCCLNGLHLQCMYLEEEIDDKFNSIYVCKKKSPEKTIIDKEVNEFIKMANQIGADVKTQGMPLGDNCSGYIVLKNKIQGYDVKP